MPPLLRDPTLQPFASTSLWNTPLGGGARWSLPADLDTIDLRRPGATIASGEWSIPRYLSAAHDPKTTFRVREDLNGNPFAVTIPCPAGAVPALPVDGGDHHMTFVWNGKLYHFCGCVRQAVGSYTADLGQIDDLRGDGLGDYGFAAGLITLDEIKDGLIPHMLRCSLSRAALKPSSDWMIGNAWPATRCDWDGPQTYTGHVAYGSTVGIPNSITIEHLNLSSAGLILATALQNFGALIRDSGGDQGVNFYAETAAEGSPRLIWMRNDLHKIVPLLCLLRNQAPATPNGGGTRRCGMLPEIAALAA